MLPEAFIKPDDIPFQSYNLDCKTVLLTIDVETDFGSQHTNALSQLDRLLDVVDELGLPLTAFVEGRFFESRQALCTMLIERDVEVELHCYDHGTSGDTPALLERSIKAYTDFRGILPLGYRAHTYRLGKGLCRALIDNGLKWDSSILPALGQGGNFKGQFRSGDYLIFDDALVEFPIASWQRIPLPLNHSYRLLIKPFGEAVLRYIDKPGALVTYNMHMVDLVHCRSLQDANLPVLVKLLYQYMWSGNRKDTFASLRDVVSYLRDLDYSFSRVDALYAQLPLRAAANPKG
jgi:peptidoglycan/xylan/chitin deacetylase (PgdA/CDA1 family)